MPLTLEGSFPLLCSMRDRPFSKMVVVEPRYAKPRYVRTLVEAARILIKEWPREPSPKHVAAQKAILEALKGNKPPSYARRAFEAAAKEAGILTIENIRAFYAGDIVKQPSTSAPSRSSLSKHPRMRKSDGKEKASPGQIGNRNRSQHVAVTKDAPL